MSWWTGIRLAFRPRLALGEAYMDGRLTVERGDLYDLLDLLGRNIAAVEAIAHGALVLRDPALAGACSSNTTPSARRRTTWRITTISGGELYDFFLDRDRQYSCAYFRTGSEISGNSRRPTRSSTSRPSSC